MKAVSYTQLGDPSVLHLAGARSGSCKQRVIDSR
jgi:hypothetical protein